MNFRRRIYEGEKLEFFEALISAMIYHMRMLASAKISAHTGKTELATTFLITNADRLQSTIRSIITLPGLMF
jgi:hypothetical protein